MLQQQLVELVCICLCLGVINLQWYVVGEGGYLYWYCELYLKDVQVEILYWYVLWMFYFNDDFDEGEIEFLFQGCKIVLCIGSLLIVLMVFIYIYCGNWLQGGDKFIVMSWILFQSVQKLFGG